MSVIASLLRCFAVALLLGASCASAQKSENGVEPAGLGMPPTYLDTCTTPTSRAEYVEEWVASANDELRRRARAFHMPVERYANFVVDFVCWALWDGRPETKHLADRKLFPFYSKLECDVDWDQHCRIERSLTLPKGWQVCRVLYRITNRRGDTRFKFSPGGWLTSQFGHVGFREYSMLFRADGSGAIFDRVGAHLVVEDVAIDAVSDRLGVDERRERGCEIPERLPPPPPKPPVKPPDARALPNRIQRIPGATKERYRVIMTNPGTVTNATYYEMWVFDPFWGRELFFQSDTIILGPGATWDYEFHKYGAERWRFASRLVGSP